MGLHEAQDGKKVVVARLEGDRGDRQKLINMGIVPGVLVKIVRKNGRAPMLLSVMGRQMMIGCGLAQKIVVR